MLFPESDRVLYKENPLVEVICQLRFPIILRIREGKLAEFQDEIRKDYPIYTEREPMVGLPPQLPKELVAILEQIKMPIPLGLVTHRFSTNDSRRFISLSDQFMALGETKYERWESFREEIVKAESALKHVYEPAFYSRAGLRYRNIISPKRHGLEHVEWKDLLKPHIIAELGDKAVLNSIVTIQTRATIKIPDIPDGQITLIHGLTKLQGSDDDCYVIDADFSIERREGVDEPFKILDKFNRLAGQLFRWAITERLHNAMEPRTI